MTKKEKLQYLKQGHQRMRDLISNLNDFQINDLKVLDDWTTKDVLSHLAAWNIENIKRIEVLLTSKEIPWWWNSPEGDDEFNEKAITQRKDKSAQEVINEWESSFQNFMKRAEELSDEEWEHNSPIPLKNFFVYEYYGLEHEGGHAKQIEGFLKNQ